VGTAYSCWMLNWWCITWPVGFKRLNGLDSIQSTTTRSKIYVTGRLSLEQNTPFRSLAWLPHCPYESRSIIFVIYSGPYMPERYKSSNYWVFITSAVIPSQWGLCWTLGRHNYHRSSHATADHAVGVLQCEDEDTLHLITVTCVSRVCFCKLHYPSDDTHTVDIHNKQRN
jgi:hypothetical protein